ncbi:MAG: 16S rRNA (guanine(527)-N(7))-methyltransferase RsmG [Rhodobacteraceae bacterium]|nr:16S rRNA (guanine(527)-N(7))-methyltransferase RsmG [Paracoccaceae bacterium]
MRNLFAVPDLENVSRETMARLTTYVALLEKWNCRINLIAPATTEDIWNRHIRDALQLYPMAKTAQKWADLGSGGGLPGLVVAIQAVELGGPDMVLIESDQRKAAFLRQVIQQLDLKARVAIDRIESLEPLNTQVVSARALAPLPKLLGYVARHLASDGKALLPKGRSWKSELSNAQQRWTFDYKVWQSRTDPEAAILEITYLEPA